MRFSRPLILLCFLLCLVSFQTGFAAVAAKKSAARKNTAAPSQTAGQFKTLDAVNGYAGHAREINPSLREFEALVEREIEPLRR